MPLVKSSLLGLVLLAAAAVPARADGFGDGLELFDRASAAREKGDAALAGDLFRQAAEKWEKLAAAGTVSARLETDIGNARALAGDLGEAVLAYRRARLIDPGEDRAEAALRSIRSTLSIEDQSRSAKSGLVHALFFWHWALTMSTREILFGAAWAVGFLLLALSLVRRRLRVPGIVLVVLGAVLLGSLLVSDAESPGADQAVLLVRTEGRTGDGTFYSPSHTGPIPAGAELTVLEDRNDWIHARLRDGSTTWVPAANATFVLPRTRARMP